MVTITRDITQWTDDAELYDSPWGYVTVEVSSSTVTGFVDWWDVKWAIGRFSNITIPQWTVITSASFSFTSASTKSITYKDSPFDSDNNCTWFEIWYVDANDVSTFSESGSISWISTLSVWTTSNSVVNNTEYTADVTALVQDIIDRAWWSSWNALALLIWPYYRGDYSNTWLDVYAYDWDPSKVMSLEIDYVWASGTASITNVSSITNITSLTF